MSDDEAKQFNSPKRMGQPAQPLMDLARQFKGLSKDVLVYGFGYALSLGISLFMAPILTRIFSVADYGIVDIITTTVGFFTLLLGINLTSGMWRYYYEIPEENEDDRRQVVSSTVWFISIISVPLTIIFYLIGPWVSELLFGSHEPLSVYRIAILTIPPRVFHNLFIGVQRLRRRPGIYLLLNLGNLLLNFILILFLLLILKMGLEGVFLAQLISFCFTVMMGIWFARDLLSFTFSWKWLKDIASYALPQLPGVFINWFMGSANRFFLNFYSTTEQVGLLSIANKVATVLVLFTSSFRLAWDPFALSIIDRMNFRYIYSRALDYYLAFMMLVGAGLTIFAQEVLIVLSPAAYWPAASLVSLLAARHILQGANNIVGIGIAVSKKTVYSSFVLAFAAIISVLANLTLTAKWSVTGAALSEMAGFFAAFVAYFIVANRVFPIPWNFENVVRLLLGFVAFILVSRVVSELNVHWLILIAIKTLALGGYAILIFNVFSHEERALVKKFPVWALARLRSRVIQR